MPTSRHLSTAAAHRFVLTPVLVAAVAACGIAAAADAPVIGLITKTETNPFFVKMKEGATEAAKAKGAKVLSGAGKTDGDNAGQVTAMENMIAGGAKTILITPSDSKAIIPSIKKARDQGVMVIALDSPTDPATAVDALYATDNFKAGVLIGQYAKGAFAGKKAKIAMLDLFPGHMVGTLRHNGFLSGFGVAGLTDKMTNPGNGPDVVCSADSFGDQAKGQTAMENCLQKNPDINLVYTINEPAAAGAYKALQAAGKEKGVMIVSVDGGCAGVKDVARGAIAATSQQYPLKMAEMGVDAGVAYAKTGKKVSGYHDTGVTLIAATSQQYPLKMAEMGVDAGVAYAKTGKKVSGYHDTGVTLIADKAVTGVDSKDTKFGLGACWGNK